MARRHKRHAAHDEEHENHERWLVTYADMLTLLMVLFIVMFAMSSVDANKFEQLKESLAGAFGGSHVLVSSNNTSSGAEAEGVSPAPIDIASPEVPKTEAQEEQEKAAVRQEQDKAAVQEAERAEASRNQEAAEVEVNRLLALRNKMKAALRRAKLADQVRFDIDERGLVVTVLTSGVVFGGDSAVLRPEGQRIVRALVPALASVRNRLEICGHTNQLPVPTRAYPTSWELSTARASSVVRYLLRFRGLTARRMTAVGYADQRPLIAPSDPRSVTMNRRVEVVVLSDQSAEVRALMAATAKGK